MTITLGVNSFTPETELYSYLDTRLNGDEFAYLAAVYEAGNTSLEIVQIFNDMRGKTFSEIEAHIIAASLDYDAAAIEEIYNTLTAGKTSIQIKNAKALILATHLIDQFEFIGRPTDTTQTLQWPRIGAIDRNGEVIPDDTIPTGIKTAANELAFFLLRNDITDPQQHNHVFLLTSYRVGESQSTFSKREDKKLPDNVMDLLKPFLLSKSGFSSALMV